MSEDALKRRDWFVGNAVRAAKQAGQNVDAEAVQRQAAKDLDLVDRAKAVGALRVGRERKKSKAEIESDTARAEQRVRDAAAKHGRIYTKALPVKDRPRRLPRLTGLDAMKLAAMKQRIDAITAPIPGYAFTRDDYFIGEDGQPVVRLGAGCKHPKLAAKVAMHSFNFAAGKGAYSGLNYEDRQNRYEAALWKICEESDAVFRVGFWVTK